MTHFWRHCGGQKICIAKPHWKPRQPAMVNYRRACQTGLNKFIPAQ